MSVVAQVRYQVSAPVLSELERGYVRDCVDNDQLTWNGSYLGKFERAFADFTGAEHAIACSSGTAALHLALASLDVKHGDDVYVPALTYVATANAVRYCGGNPVFVDVDLRTWGMSPTDLNYCIERRIRATNRRPKVILPVHLYGVPCDMDAIRYIANVHGAYLVEDAAQAHGATYHNRQVGTLGDIGVFSFYANKLITCGEGGAVITQDVRIANRVRSLIGHATHPTKRYFHTEVGYNYRMTNMQAAIGYGQVQKYPENLRRRQAVVDAYNGVFQGRFLVPTPIGDATAVPWLYTFLLPVEVSRDLVAAQLAAVGIETRPVFVPLPELPMYRGITPAIAEDIARRGLSLPTHPALGVTDASFIANEVVRLVA